MKNAKLQLILCIIVSIFIMPKMANAQYGDISEPDFKSLRYEMVKRQIQARGIKDPRVLEAMRKVERHKFVPEEIRLLSYTDNPLPIGEGQTISQPYIVALMTELLELDGDERVLEIGTGSGYQAAILAEIAESVFTIEILPKLAEKASKLLKALDTRTYS